MTRDVSIALSFASGYGVFGAIPELEADTFRFAETTRGAALASAAIARASASDERYPRLRAELRAASDDSAALAHKGTSSDELIARARGATRPNARSSRCTVRSATLRPAWRATRASSVRTWTSTRLSSATGVTTRWRATRADERDDDGRAAHHEVSVDSLCAFVVRRARPNDASARTARARRARTDRADRERGARLARRDRSLRSARSRAGRFARRFRTRARGANCARSSSIRCSGARRSEARRRRARRRAAPRAARRAAGQRRRDGLVGDRWRIETRCDAHGAACAPRPNRDGDALLSRSAARRSTPLAARTTAAEDVAAAKRTRVANRCMPALVLRGGAWERGFEPLHAHRPRGARHRCAVRRDRSDGRRASSCSRSARPRARRCRARAAGALAARRDARLVRAGVDPLVRAIRAARQAERASAARMSGEEQVQGHEPDAPVRPRARGREPARGRARPRAGPGHGRGDRRRSISRTASSRCLSACDTNVGERRAGQGVASLQKALQMAGARSVITSLWKVPDEATKELMLDFYRRLWVEKKPKCAGAVGSEDEAARRARTSAAGRSTRRATGPRGCSPAIRTDLRRGRTAPGAGAIGVGPLDFSASFASRRARNAHFGRSVTPTS